MGGGGSRATKKQHKKNTRDTRKSQRARETERKKTIGEMRGNTEEGIEIGYRAIKRKR